MIKKTISFTLIIVLILLTYQFIITFFKDNHYITYTIGKDELFNIEEKYIKKNKQDYYLIKVNHKEDNYVFKIENEYNKQKNIVENVKVFEQDGFYCIGLDLVGKDKYSYPECSKDNITYSYSSIKDKIDFKDYIDKIVDNNKSRYLQESVKKDELGLTINRSYIDDDEIVIVYGYKQMILLYPNFSRTFSFSSMDNYKNIYGTLVDNYYMIPKMTSLPTFGTYVRYDVVDGIKDEIELPVSISKQSYINGVYDHKLYIFDKSNKTQFEIDPDSKEIKTVGNVDEEGITVENGKKKKISVYELEKNEVLFEDKKVDYIDVESTHAVSNEYYAIYESNGTFYKVYKDYPDIKILLFSDSEAKNVKIKKDNIYYIKDNGLYKYNEYGTFGIAYRNEFIYNYDNIYDVYLK